MTKTAALRRVSADDLTRISWPIEPAIHPSGDWIAYSRVALEEVQDQLGYEIRVQESTGGREIMERRRGRAPKWSPDGECLAWLGTSNDSLHLVGTRDCDEFGLESILDGVGDYDWSPAGETIVATPPRPEARATGAEASLVEMNVLRFIDLSDPERLRLRSIPMRAVISAHWSPAQPGRVAIIGDDFDSRVGTGDSGVWLLSDGSCEPRCLFKWHGPTEAVAWSPDGTHLAVIGHQHSRGRWVNKQLWIVPIDPNSSPWQLGEHLDRSIGQVVRGDDQRGIGPPDLHWSVDGEAVHSAYAIGGRSVLGRFDLSGSHEILVDGERAVLEFDVADLSGDVAFTWSDPENPGEVSILKNDDEFLLSRLNDDWLQEVQLAPTVPIDAEGSDGAIVEGWLTTPDGTDKPSPLVAQIHGGPHYPVGYRFSFDAQRLAARGIALLRGNPHGSQGYGEQYAASIRGDWGGPDRIDVMALVDAASSRPGIDGSSVGILGESYGGFLTNWIITQSRRFKAAVVENGISDLYSLGIGENGPSFWHLEFDGSPADVPERYLDRSPISHAIEVHTPLLLIHAERDENCPISQSERLLTILKASGRDVELIGLPDEGHFVNVFGRPSSRKTRARAIDDFFLVHLMPASVGPSER